jgi:hypothetical protein
MVIENPDIDVTVSLSQIPDGGRVRYRAAAPPDYRASYSGSALPFANTKQAFGNTPNSGEVIAKDGQTVQLKLRYPNAYYAGLGTVYIPPTVYVEYSSAGKLVREALRISDGVPFRTLTYPAYNTRPRSSCMFYDAGDLPVRSQEAILRASEYPQANEMPDNFWGTKPPV